MNDASNSATTVSKSLNPDEAIEDPFGYPLHFGAFGHGASQSVAKYSQEFKVSADFALCYHVKCTSGEFFRVFDIIGFLFVTYSDAGYLNIRFNPFTISLFCFFVFI